MNDVVPDYPHPGTTNLAITWADDDRPRAFHAWLSSVAVQHGINPATARLASADASFRRYFRVDTAQSPTGSYIVMDAPPDKEDCAPFVKVAALMADAALNAPRVLAWDAPTGFMLLSDLGAQTMMDAINNALDQPPATPAATAMHESLYLEAVDALIRWQLASKPGVLPLYDDALLSRELALFPDWYVGKHRCFTLDTTAQSTLDKAFALIKASNLQSLDGASVYVHRDFMPRNLMMPSSLEAGLGVLDFQDAVYGPITYDIASLMRDAFLSWEEDFVLDITVRYWQRARKAGLPVGDDFGEFYRAVEWMGLQRHLKILGIFARLTLRDGKPRYLADTLRFIKYVRATCARYRQLGPLMVLLDEIEGNETRVGYTF
jgi:aminoglycoside/choline kinase family phosphotransferase